MSEHLKALMNDGTIETTILVVPPCYVPFALSTQINKDISRDYVVAVWINKVLA